VSLALQAFAIALLASLALTPLVRHVARHYGLVAAPQQDRWHRRPTALMGGVAIYLACVLAVFLVVGGAGDPAAPFRQLARPGVAILLAATLMFIAGLADDRFGLKPASKLVLQALAAAIVVSGGIIYPVSGWVPLDTLITVFWVLALTNALNLLDNMDGVAVGVGGLAAAFLAISFGMQGVWGLAIVCAALAGASFGFLPYNFHPASIFMGDSGSLFLGVMLASLGAAYPATVPVGLLPVLFVPVFVVIIPILDTTLVTTMRTLAGRPISVGGRDHTSHRLVAMGLSERQVALLLYAFAITGGSIALALSRAGAGLGNWLGLLFLVGLTLLAAYLGRMHSYGPGEALPSGRVTWLLSNLFHKRRALEAVLDLVLFAAAYYGAYLLRFEAVLPAPQVALFETSLVLVIACKSVAFALAGTYRSVWEYASVADMHRVFRASVLGSVLAAALLLGLFPVAGLSVAVLVVDFMLTLLLAAGVRLSFRSLDRLHRELRPDGVRTLVYGAGAAGELLVRELFSNPSLGIRPIGLIDDDPRLRGRSLHGLDVLGTAEDLPEILLRQRVEKILVASRDMDPERMERLSRICSTAGIEVMEFSLHLVPLRGGAAEARPLQHRLASD
jgi:UDP-GlcNAc:undecaprenyl-phosphate/decaprenyl-phosphate GlcNAc-1-phosphate transferase